MPQESAVEIRGIARSFTAKGQVVDALGPIDLSVRHGEFVSLVGPSGCGKSTLLNIVAGLLRQTIGQVLVCGKHVAGTTPPEIGMMFQNPVLLDWRTARMNVLLPAEIEDGRMGVKAAQGRADELLELVGLSGFEDRYPWELSGGMQQRVAVCRMLIADPQVLLLDEPFGSLDELTREHMNLEFSRIFETDAARSDGRHRTAILVTHNIQEAVFLADRVYVVTSRPGCLADVVEVSLPKPRDLDVMTTPEFQAIVGRVRSTLHSGTTASENADGGAIE